MPLDELVTIATFVMWGTIYGYKQVAQSAKQRREMAAKGARLQTGSQDDGALGVYGEVFRRREPDAPGQAGLAGLVALGTDDSAPLLFQRNTGGPPLGLKELASARRLSAATVASSTHLALGLLGAMYGCTQGTTRKPSGSDEAGREAAVWAPGLVVRHRRGGSVGLGLGALALSACGSSSCATLDTLARCSSSANSSAASTGGDASAGGPGSEGPGMEPNMSYALGAAAQDPGGASSDSEDDGGCGDACERAGSWGGAGAGAGQGRVGRRRSGRCEGVYLPAWSSLSLLAGAASPGGAAAEQEQLEATVAAGSPPSEPQSVEQAGPGSAPRRVLLAAAEALEPVLESPQEENEEVEGQQLESPRANTSSPFAACCQQPAANMLVETPHTTRAPHTKQALAGRRTPCAGRIRQW
eukprot:XP_001691187.1 predicted protein [Chlamydomonas reinhardtii]